jgi:hypothetical protein
MVAALKLTRDELAKFLGGDHAMIRQFETLFKIADSVGTDGIEDLKQLAIAANGLANIAIALTENTPLPLATIPSDTLNFLQITPSPTAPQDLKIRWDSLTNGLIYQSNSVPIGIGMESMVYVRNNTGSTITKGTPVKIDTVTAQLPAVSPAFNTTPNNVIGVMAADMPTATQAYAQVLGVMRSIDATGTPYGETWASGDILYLSATGVTNIPPAGYRVIIGKVIAPVVNGSIMIQIANGMADLANDQTTLLRTFATLSNGAGGSVGFLNNAPTAGNPTKWIPINDNGTVRYVPSWL